VDTTTYKVGVLAAEADLDRDLKDAMNELYGHSAYVKVHLGANQAIPTGLPHTAISWDTEVSDDQGFWAASPNPTRLTCPASRPGLYRVLACVTFAAGNAPANARVMKNGAPGTGATVVFKIEGDFFSGVSLSLPLEGVCVLEAGDYLEVYVDQYLGSNRNALAGLELTWVALIEDV
jgi:hypothetical protein